MRSIVNILISGCHENTITNTINQNSVERNIILTQSFKTNLFSIHFLPLETVIEITLLSHDKAVSALGRSLTVTDGPWMAWWSVHD